MHSPRRATATLSVVDLSEALRARRVTDYKKRLNEVLEANEHAVGRLFLSRSLFTREGVKAGRQLLLAHEHLLKVSRLLERLAHRGDVPAPRTPLRVEEVFAELDLLLKKTAELRRRTVAVLASLEA